MCITFVTSFFHIYDKDYDKDKTIEWRIERFCEIASSGIKLCVYASPELFQIIPRDYTNVCIIELSTPFIETICSKMELALPQQRNIDKDTAKYMYVINSKTDLIADAIHRSIWNSTHFAWIDFNITHVFSHKERTLRFLRELDLYEFPKTCMLLPGCWSKHNNVNIEHITESINWRFCGGFFIGDKASLLRLDDLYKMMFPKFVEKYKRIIWEVNFWAWLEVNSNWNPQWYLANHDDSIITNIPCANIATVLKTDNIETETSYMYPSIPLFHPSSASYLKFKGEHLLNTRYVNYYLYNNGSYLFYDGQNIIQNKNVFSRLSEDMVPIDYQEMSDDSIEFPRYNMYSQGIEDIRLYEHNGRVRFIATTVGYQTTCGNKMMIGNYDYNTLSYSDVNLIDSPMDAYCEKNWAPIPSSDGLERFVYKWSPFTAGAAAPRTPPCGGFTPRTPPAFANVGADAGANAGANVGADAGAGAVACANADADADTDIYFDIDIDTKVINSDDDDSATYVVIDTLNAAPHDPLHTKFIITHIFPITETLPFFDRMKGSSAFVEYNGELVGVTHFSEDALPRRYFHMLVVLDKTTYMPLRYSKPFIFDRVGIEFCIGFDVLGYKYRFWISRLDRNPVLYEVNTNIISFHNVYED
jgi:hypothetical protein